MALKKLPIGLQDLRKIIEYDFKYIDKTRYIYQICQSPGAYFLSRPRRFGKSITIVPYEIKFVIIPFSALSIANILLMCSVVASKPWLMQ